MMEGRDIKVGTMTGEMNEGSVRGRVLVLTGSPDKKHKPGVLIPPLL